MLLERRSCRSFTEEQVPDEALKTIIDCGLNAPSGCNEQASKIVVVQDPEKVRLLSDLNNRIWKQQDRPFLRCADSLPHPRSQGRRLQQRLQEPQRG